jgi:hypothetical protein
MTGLFLAFSVLLVTTVAAMAALLPAPPAVRDIQAVLQEGNPFAFMKNEYKETIQDFSQEESVVGDVTIPTTGFSNGGTKGSLSNEAGLGESLLEDWKDLPLKAAVPVRRYIVKYKEGEASQTRAMVAPFVSRVQTVREKADGFRDNAPVSVEAVNPALTDALSPVRSAVWDMERLEVLTLTEPMLPSAFAQQLEDVGISAHLEYIQPDFCLSLDDLSLTLELETTSESETTSTDGTELILEGESIQGRQTGGEEEPAQAAPVLVAVIDTGVDTEHEALMDFLVEGYNAMDGTNVVYGLDLPAAYTHGTHVSGLIADAAKETGANVKILPIQAFRNGVGYTSDILAAIAYAEEQGASIVNCSFGSTADNPALYEAIQNSGMLFVCATGNSRRDMAETPSYPAAYDLPNVIGVASVNADGGISYFSNYGAGIADIAAPGRSVMSTIPENGVGPMTGTSMSAGLVTGAAAAVLSLCRMDDPDFDLDSLRARLLDTADQLSSLQGYISEGRRLNLTCTLEGENLDGVLDLTPEEDADEAGYREDTGEQFTLYSGEDNQATNIVVSAVPVYPPQDSSVYRYLLIGYVTATVYDADNNVLTGQSLTFGLQNGDGSVFVDASTGQILLYFTATSYPSSLEVWATCGSIKGYSPPLPATVPANLTVSLSSSSLTVPQSGSVTASAVATVRNSSNAVLTGQSVSYALVSSYTGVSINSSSGLITVSSSASVGTVTIRATCGNAINTAALHLTLQPGAPATLTVTVTPGTLTIPFSGSSTATATATVRDANNTVLTGQTITYSLVTLQTGVSINSGTGVVTVSSTATAGTVTVRGTCGSVTGTATLTISMPAPANITVTLTPGSVTVPTSGTVSSTATATVRDANNNILTGQTVTYSLPISKAGVSINGSTGVVTVSSTATAGTVTVRGTCGSVTGTAMLTISTTTSAANITLQATANQIYHISVKGHSVTSFSGTTYAVTYDSSKLTLQDFAAQTKQGKTTPGAVAGTGLTIVSHSGGVLTFTVQKTIQSGYKWSGVLTVLKFKALSTGSSSLQIS